MDGSTNMNSSIRPLVLEGSRAAGIDVIAINSFAAGTILAALLGIALPLLLTDRGISILTHLIILLPGRTRSPAIPGCKRVGIPRQRSNLLNDEFHSKYRHGDADGDGKSWKIKSLWIYPVKSCAGVELEESVVEKTGLQYDRMFSFAKKEKGRWKFTTLRSFPRMALVDTELWVPDPSATDFSKVLPSVKTQGVVRIVFPNPRAQGKLARLGAALQGKPNGHTITIDLPLQPTPEQIVSEYVIGDFEIWQERTASIDMSKHLRPELLEYIGADKPGMEIALFRCYEKRELFRDAPRKEELGYQPVAGFNDAYPVNLLGLSSLQAMDELQHSTRQQHLEAKGKDLGMAPRLSARRFRANIVIEGAPEFEEETWNYIHLDKEEFYVVARCVRCKLPNVDPDTGLAHKNFPDVAIRKMRNIDKGAPKNTGCMAVQLVPRRELGHVRVGDVINVKKRGELVYTPMSL